MKQQLLSFLIGAVLATPVMAAEYPIGEPSEQNGLEIAAVYLQPVQMEPAGMMREAKDSDIHLEADIHATADNKNGLPEGAWAPYLNIGYEDRKSVVSGKSVSLRVDLGGGRIIKKKKQ